MSYRFEMCFKPIATFPKAMAFAAKAVEILAKEENAKQMIEDNRHYMPAARIHATAEEKGQKTVRYLLDSATDYYLYHLFNTRFVYFHRQKLLAVIGAAYPDDFKKQFKTVVYFQNSCDQDYGREDWKGIKYFTDIFDNCMAMSLDDLLATSEYDGYNKEEMQNSSCGLDYYRRSLAYKKIYNELCLDDWLWGHNNPSFTRFSLGAINTQEQMFNLHLYARKLEQLGGAR